MPLEFRIGERTQRQIAVFTTHFVEDTTVEVLYYQGAVGIPVFTHGDRERSELPDDEHFEPSLARAHGHRRGESSHSR